MEGRRYENNFIPFSFSNQFHNFNRLILRMLRDSFKHNVILLYPIVYKTIRGATPLLKSFAAISARRYPSPCKQIMASERGVESFSTVAISFISSILCYAKQFQLTASCLLMFVATA